MYEKTQGTAPYVELSQEQLKEVNWQPVNRAPKGYVGSSGGLDIPTPLPPLAEYTNRANEALHSLHNTAERLRNNLDIMLRAPTPEAQSARGGDVEPAPPSAICGGFHEIECRARSIERVLIDIMNRLTI